MPAHTTATGVHTGLSEPGDGRLKQIYCETRDEQESDLSVFVFVWIRSQSLLEDLLKNVVFSLNTKQKSEAQWQGYRNHSIIIFRTCEYVYLP